MPRLVVDLRRTADPTNAVDPSGAGGVPTYFTDKGVFDVKLPATIRNVRRVAIEGYTVAGIALISVDNLSPRQPYLAVQFDKMRPYDDELLVGRKDLTDPTVPSASEKGYAIPIEEGPWFHRHIDTAASRLIFHGDIRTTHMQHLKISVTGPNGEIPEFSRMTLFLRVETDADAPTHSALPSIAAGVNSETVPDSGVYAITGIRGAVYQ